VSRAPAHSEVTGVILAGGQARRMGGEDKGLVALGGRAMIEYAIDALRPQVDALLINANRNTGHYQRYGYPVLPDLQGGYCGPLAGMASAMAAAATAYLVTVPCDSPRLCQDLVARLDAALQAEGAEIAVAHDGERLQPVFALMQTALYEDLTAWLARGERKIDRWYAEHRVAVVDFRDRLETFENVNTPEERDALWRRMRASHAPHHTAQQTR